MNTKLINGLVFKKAFYFKEGCFGVYDLNLFESIGGVYVVYANNTLQYIGSYSNKLQQRWINGKLNKFIHFKAKVFIEMSKASSTEVIIYALTRKSIREQLLDSEYINHESVESRLIEILNPPMNIVKKNDANQFSQSEHPDQQTLSS